MKKGLLIFGITFFILALKTPPALAQTKEEDSCLCDVKYLPARPKNYHPPVLKNSDQFCDTIHALLSWPDTIPVNTESEFPVVEYIASLEFQVSSDGPPANAKVAFCSQVLQPFIMEKTPDIISLMQWERAYYSKRKKKVATNSRVNLNVKFIMGKLVSVAFFDDENSTLFSCKQEQ